MRRGILRTFARVTDQSRHPPPVTSTDALKALALALILVDHVGHYLANDWPILRAVGRLGVPVFFFLIGFAKSRDIPWAWLVLGVVLTGVDFLWLRGFEGLQLNILFNFAAIRLALPMIERHAFNPHWRLPVLVFGLAALIPVLNPILEYGTEGWLFAMLGLLCRQRVGNPAARREIECVAAAIFAFGVYGLVETIDYSFSVLHSGILMIGLLAVALLLLTFKRRVLEWQPGPGIGALLRFSGRHSLEIYAAQIILLAALGGLWNAGQGLTR